MTDVVFDDYAAGQRFAGFASQSTAEFQQRKRSLAQAASCVRGKTISTEQVRAKLSMIEGRDVGHVCRARTFSIVSV